MKILFKTEINGKFFDNVKAAFYVHPNNDNVHVYDSPNNGGNLTGNVALLDGHLCLRFIRVSI